jgi:Na+/melibiose symporter-like transporter
MAPYLVAADCADYASWKNRSESRAIHVSIVSVIVKLGSLSAAASVVMAGLLGFDPKLAVQPLATIHLLKALGLFIPFVCLLAGGVIVMTHPITRRRQTAIQRRLDRRLGAAAAAGALVGATGVEAAISQGPLGHGLGDAAAL